MTESPSPQFQLSTIITEEDYTPLFLLDYASFSTFPEIAHAFFPGGLDPAHRAANIESLKLGVFSGPDVVCAKINAVNHNDRGSGDKPESKEEIAGFISCRICRSPLGILGDKSKPPITLPRVQDPEERAFYEWYWNALQEKLRDIKEFQIPHITIQAIATHPSYRRKGVGTMLMNWYVDLARREGIGRCALYAGPFAVQVGFYEKSGFQRGRVMEFSDERWPERMGTREVVMWRDV